MIAKRGRKQSSVQAVEELLQARFVESILCAREERFAVRAGFGGSTEATEGVDRHDFALHRKLPRGKLRGVILRPAECFGGTRGQGSTGFLDQENLLR